MTSSVLELFLSGLILVLIQVLAALPWLYVVDSESFRSYVKRLDVVGGFVGGLLVAGAIVGYLLSYNNDPNRLADLGWWYGTVLHLQLSVDSVILALWVLLLVWPRGGTVAQATLREGYRQPMFWLLLLAVIILMFGSAIIPYFTFGDDYKMMKQLGFDMIMLTTMLFCVLLASMSVSEEIEGRTAVTLMSKPVTRRQFLLGKFFGILLAGWLMTMFMAGAFNWALWLQPQLDRLPNEIGDPLTTQVQNAVIPYIQMLGVGPTGKAFFKGVGIWQGETLANLLGQIMGFGLVMVMLAIAVSLATRLSMVVNLVCCLVIFFLGNLSQVLVQAAQQLQGGALALVGFLARLFDILLPSLQYASTSQVYIRETPLEAGAFAAYVGSVFGYFAVYTVIALLVGLILFEDRDLA
ncbi:MAG TPA: ABC transporter permease subunit [Gemmataceae bacterium]|jgi:ABC-type transport system involved in multi-copper enzyme maturation permease subunit